MSIISCSYNCKHQRDGYCYLNDISHAKHSDFSGCIYFEPTEDEAENVFFNSSSDSEPL